jgi:hypothetical protein
MNKQYLFHLSPYNRKIAPRFGRERLYRDCDYCFSQTWLPTVQEVLQADWQEAGHSPQPPVFNVLLSIALLTVLMCFFMTKTSDCFS